MLFEELARLPERERRVLLRRHGLEGGEPATLREMAEELGISRERVRHLQRKAERRLRSSAGMDAAVPAGPRRGRLPERGRSRDPDRRAEGETPGRERMTA
jgi:DNA-binding CsgD family transcriptional regulator